MLLIYMQNCEEIVKKKKKNHKYESQFFLCVSNMRNTMNNTTHSNFCTEFTNVAVHLCKQLSQQNNSSKTKAIKLLFSFMKFFFALTFVQIFTLQLQVFVYIPLLFIFLFIAEEIYLNSRTFLWPHELEQVLELSGARLSVVRENLEVALK